MPCVGSRMGVVGGGVGVDCNMFVFGVHLHYRSVVDAAIASRRHRRVL